MLRKGTTFKDIANARLVFEKFLTKELPFPIARKIQLFMDESKPFMDLFKKTEKELIDEYAEKDDAGEVKIYTENNDASVHIDPKKLDEFNEKFNGLLNDTIEYNLDEDIYFRDEELMSLNCTPEEIHYINWIIIA